MFDLKGKYEHVFLSILNKYIYNYVNTPGGYTVVRTNIKNIYVLIIQIVKLFNVYSIFDKDVLVFF